MTQFGKTTLVAHDNSEQDKIMNKYINTQPHGIFVDDLCINIQYIYRQCSAHAGYLEWWLDSNLHSVFYSVYTCSQFCLSSLEYTVWVVVNSSE